MSNIPLQHSAFGAQTLLSHKINVVSPKKIDPITILTRDNNVSSKLDASDDACPGIFNYNTASG